MQSPLPQCCVGTAGITNCWQQLELCRMICFGFSLFASQFPAHPALRVCVWWVGGWGWGLIIAVQCYTVSRTSNVQSDISSVPGALGSTLDHCS